MKRMNITITVTMKREPGDPKEITLKAALRAVKKAFRRALKLNYRELAKATIEQNGTPTGCGLELPEIPLPKPRHASKPKRGISRDGVACRDSTVATCWAR